MGRSGDLAARAPLPVLAVTLALVLAGAQLDTEFNQEQFVPEDTRAGSTLGLMHELFGGEVRERSYLVVDGDVEGPDLLNAMLEVGDRLTGTEHVATGPQALSSPAHLIRRLVEAGTSPDSPPPSGNRQLSEAAEQLRDPAGPATGWPATRMQAVSSTSSTMSRPHNWTAWSTAVVPPWC